MGAITKHRFEDYTLVTGRTNVGDVPFASLDEFFSLVGTGETAEQALDNLRKAYSERLTLHEETGKPIPAPGSGRAAPEFAPDDEVQALRPIVEDFWREILGTMYASSFVSNDSRLSSWEHYVKGGQEEIIRRVQDRYGVDISRMYEERIPSVLRYVKEASPTFACSRARTPEATQTD